MHAMLTVNKLTKKYGSQTAVDNVNFSVPQGEIWGLLGPNGAGKSTTIAIISTLLRPTSGDVLVQGHSVLSAPDRVRKLIGLVPQDIALYPTLSAYENLAFFGRMYGLRGQKLKARVAEVLDITGLTARAKDRVETFSGGMQRRLNIGVGLMNRPALLILDEPTVGIDPQSRRHILETIKHLNASDGMTVLYTSHYMEEVEFLCDRVGIIDHGRLIAQGTKEELKQLVGERETIEIRTSGVSPAAIAHLRQMTGVDEVLCAENTIKVLTGSAGAVLSRIVASLNSFDCKIKSFRIQEPNLESVFLHLTGKGLRDGRRT